MKDKIKNNQKGFTLIELLIVIVIIGILAVIIFVAVDPAQRFADARNARRFSEVNSVLDAVLKFQVDNGGSLPTGIDAVAGTAQVLGTDAAGCDSGCAAAGTTVAACLDLDSDLVDEYLAAMPQDPSVGDAGNTGYFINQTTNGRLQIGSCGAENGVSISVQR